MNRKQLYGIFKTSFHDWIEDNATLRAAALTFFIILPLPTLLLIVVAIFAQFFGQTQATQILLLQISAVAGPAVSELFRQLLSNAGSPFSSIWTAIVLVGFSFGGAIGAFSVLRDTMDCIWEINVPKGLPLWRRIRQRIGPFVLLSALGLIIIVWTVISNRVFNLINQYSINDTLTSIGLATAQVALSFGVATLLLAIIYKTIPETRVHWRDVTLASAVTSLAFIAANYIFGTYIQIFVVTTVIGTAGALLIILIWIFVLNQIVLFGAELSKNYATTVGAHARKHQPEPVERIIQPLARASEIIEKATKNEFETQEKTEH
jgi:membrane protein